MVSTVFSQDRQFEWCVRPIIQIYRCCAEDVLKCFHSEFEAKFAVGGSSQWGKISMHTLVASTAFEMLKEAHLPPVISEVMEAISSFTTENTIHYRPSLKDSKQIPSLGREMVQLAKQFTHNFHSVGSTLPDDESLLQSPRSYGSL